MSKTVHPYAHRLGILRDWRSRWFAKKGTYQANLKADVLLREFLEKKLREMYVDAIETERGQNSLRVIIRTSRPGMIIGRSGEGSVKLKNDIIALLKKIGAAIPRELNIDIQEVRSPESHAGIVAHMVVEQLEKRLPFRRTLKQTAEKVMANRDVQGVRIHLSGRLDGAEMSRSEGIRRGRIPLQTFRADVDFARGRAHLPYGDLGIKVWIYRGMIFGGKEEGEKSRRPSSSVPKAKEAKS